MFEYHVKYYCSGDCHEDYGLIGGAETYADAVKQLTRYYGDECIEEFTVRGLSDSTYVLPYDSSKMTSIEDKIDV